MKFKAYWANKTPLRYLTASCLPQDNRIINSSEPKKWIKVAQNKGGAGPIFTPR